MMKKVLLGLIAAAAITSCVKRAEVTPVENGTQIGSATITGTYWAKTDLEGDTLPNGQKDPDAGYTPMEGLAVIAIVNESDLDRDGAGGNASALARTYTTTTNADGQYTITVDAVAENGGVDVDIYVDGELMLDVSHRDADRAIALVDTNDVPTGEYELTTESLKFEVSDVHSTTVIKGQNKVMAREEVDAVVFE